MTTAGLALLVASIWGITPIFEKLSLERASPLTVITLRFMFTATCFGVYSAVTGGYKDFGSVDGKTLLYIILAAVFGGIIGLLVFFTALKQDFTTKIVPIAATFPLFTALYAYMFLNEHISSQRLVGIIFIVIGLILVNWNSISYSD